MLKKLIPVCLILWFGTQLLASNSLRIIDPQRNWFRGQGTIEEATLSITPKGIYMEYGLYLTLSGKDLNLDSSTQYEIEFFFDLPEKAIVQDSWLWVEGEIIRENYWTNGPLLKFTKIS